MALREKNFLIQLGLGATTIAKLGFSLFFKYDLNFSFSMLLVLLIFILLAMNIRDFLFPYLCLNPYFKDIKKKILKVVDAQFILLVWSNSWDS